MARRKGAMRNTPREAGSSELRYAKRKAAGWLLAVLDKGADMDASFFECLEWLLGGLGPLLESVRQASAELRSKAGRAAHEAVTLALAASKRRRHHECEELIEEHPCTQDIFADKVSALLTAMEPGEAAVPGFFAQARGRLEEVFGLESDALELCEFAFLLQHFSPIECYFEDRLSVFRLCNRHYLARMFGQPEARLARRIRELESFGFFKDAYSDSFRLAEELLAFWSTDEADSLQLFSRPLEGESLPLDSFRLAPEEVRHVRRLMESRGDAPLHILLYGTSGTGKSTFARSLAKACGVKAWSVNSRDTDDDKARRASLAACLHLASRHEGSFVVVDEAERLLDTELTFGRQTKDKAWLNDFLEKPGQRIVWISNQVGHIDPAVRRRFAYTCTFRRWACRSAWISGNRF